MSLESQSALQDYKLKSRRLVIPFSITGNATPASKVHASDLAGHLYLSTEGKTAEAAAIDSGAGFTTEADATGIFGILIANSGSIKKLLDAQLVNLSSGTAVLSRKGASSSGVTASGNIAVSIDSSLDLSAANLSAHLVLDYILAE